MPRRLTALGAEQLMARVVVQASALRREPAVPGTELAVLAAVTQMRLISAAAAAADQQLMAPTERQLPEATAGPQAPQALQAARGFQVQPPTRNGSPSKSTRAFSRYRPQAQRVRPAVRAAAPQGRPARAVGVVRPRALPLTMRMLALEAIMVGQAVVAHLLILGLTGARASRALSC